MSASSSSSSWICSLCGDKVPNTIKESEHRQSLSHLFGKPMVNALSSSAVTVLSSTLSTNEDEDEEKQSFNIGKIKLPTPIPTNVSSSSSSSSSGPLTIVPSISKGRQLLEKLNWKQNTGLGKYEHGRIEPILVSGNQQRNGIGIRAKTNPNIRSVSTTVSTSSHSTGNTGSYDMDGKNGRGNKTTVSIVSTSTLKSSSTASSTPCTTSRNATEQEQLRKRRQHQIELFTDLPNEYTDILINSSLLLSTTDPSNTNKQGSKKKKRRRR